MSHIGRKPPWLKKSLPTGPAFEQVRHLLKHCSLNTVCESARCPNIWECFSARTATFLIMGNRCTRDCRFCAVLHGPRDLLDPDEPRQVAQAAEQMGLHHVVVTSVTRDDLKDYGASCFAETIRRIRQHLPSAAVEVLIPDFKADPESLDRVIMAGPDIIAHNIETVPRLYPQVRAQSDYNRSLSVLRYLHEQGQGIPVKSGIMLGMGETEEEIEQTLKDLVDAGSRMLSMGQYLQPTRDHFPVRQYLPPKAFSTWKKRALALGFHQVAAGPFVRSSYHAGESYQAMQRSEMPPAPAADPR